ncbi:MAG: DUF4258 domain-containing protein [Egibacteraceae bacterium]
MPKDVPLKLSQHALDRLRERGILEDDVRWALARRIGRSEPGQPGSVWIRGYASGGRILKVCVRQDDESRVITAVWPD